MQIRSRFIGIAVAAVAASGVMLNAEWQAAPVALYDQAHFNNSRIDAGYAIAAEILRAQSLEVVASTGSFTRELLRPAAVLVISNAVGVKSSKEWNILPAPPAFSGEEVAAVVDWLREGGSLLLIVDHMPFPAANEALTAALGFKVLNGGAVADRPAAGIGMPFTRQGGTLRDHDITRGRTPGERIEEVRTMAGCAFQSPAHAEPLLVLPDGVTNLEPLTRVGPNGEPPKFRRLPVAGWHQAAALRFGKGRVVLVGEAGLFSRRPEGVIDGFGIDAAQNRQFLVNVVRWLLER